MRTDLPVSFVTELTRQGREPRQLLEFAFAAGTIYVSDQEYGSALLNAYLPIVESWGKLEDVSLLRDIIDGTSSGTLQATITLHNRGARPFSSYFNAEAPENISIKLYQWFEGIPESDKVLIGEFVAQDPIHYTESSMLLQLDMVSHNQYADPYVGQLSPGDNEFHGVVLGAISGVQGTAYGVRPIVQLASDVTATQTTIYCTADPAAAGFPAAGTFVLDYEAISYTSISDNAFLGCSRQRHQPAWSPAWPHSAGQNVFEYGREYFYSFGQGPLDAMGPVYLDGEIYTGQYTIYKDVNPVLVGFMDGDPFLKITGPDTFTSNVLNYYFTSTYSLTSTNYWQYTTAAQIGICDGNSCYLEIAGAVTDIQLDEQIADIKIAAGGGIGSSLADHAELISAHVIAKGHLGYFHNFVKYNHHAGIMGSGTWSQEAWVQDGSVVGAAYTTTLDMTSYGWDGAKSGYAYGLAVIGSQYSSGAVGEAGILDCVTTEIVYRPYRKSYSVNVTCDLSSGTGNTNPADAIKTILSIIGIAGAIDTVSFAAAKAWYVGWGVNGYLFNGFIPGDMRCRDALSSMCQQSRSRLVYNGGLIKLHVRAHLENKTIVQQYTPTNSRLRSIEIERGSIRDVCNKLTVRYSAINVQADYQSSTTAVDQASIDQFGLHEQVLSFYLINDPAVAADLAAFYLRELANPYIFLTFAAYLEAFPLEVDDVVRLDTDFGDIQIFVGEVASITRQFGSGKIGSINLFKCVLRSATNKVIELPLTDLVTAADTETTVIS